MKSFNKYEQQILKQIISARRDVRGNHFIQKEIPKEILEELLSSANNAPSVGFSQPWRFVIIQSKEIRGENLY